MDTETFRDTEKFPPPRTYSLPSFFHRDIFLPVVPPPVCTLHMLYVLLFKFKKMFCHDFIFINLALVTNNLEHSGTSATPEHHRDDFKQMINVFVAHFWSHCWPKFCNAFNTFLFVSGLLNRTYVFLDCILHVLRGIHIWGFWWGRLVCDVFLLNRLCGNANMLRIIVLN